MKISRDLIWGPQVIVDKMGGDEHTLPIMKNGGEASEEMEILLCE